MTLFETTQVIDNGEEKRTVVGNPNDASLALAKDLLWVIVAQEARSYDPTAQARHWERLMCPEEEFFRLLGRGTATEIET